MSQFIFKDQKIIILKANPIQENYRNLYLWNTLSCPPPKKKWQFPAQFIIYKMISIDYTCSEKCIFLLFSLWNGPGDTRLWHGQWGWILGQWTKEEDGNQSPQVWGDDGPFRERQWTTGACQTFLISLMHTFWIPIYMT